MSELFQTLKEVADRTPGSVATFSRAGWLHHATFHRNVEAIAGRALELGIKRGDLVVIATGHQDARLQMTLGLMRIGCRVGVSQSIEQYASHGLAIDTLVTDDPKLKAGKRTIPLGPDWFKPSVLRARALPPPAPYSLIFSSSGSTGVGKLMEISEAGFWHRVSAKLTDTYLKNRPRFLSTAGDGTSTTLQDTVAALLAGGMVIRPFDRSAGAILDAIQLHRPTYAVMSPATLVAILQLLDQTAAQFDKIGTLRLAGAYCAPETQQRGLDLIADRIVTSYGASEIGRVASGFTTDTARVERSVGRVKDDVEVIAVDAEGRPLPPGSAGELRIKVPPGVAATYPGSAASASFVDGWFLPGDIGKIDADRNLIILGRSSQVINIGGNKVHPEAIEAAALGYAGIREIGLVGIDGAEGFQRVHAAIVSASPIDLFRLNNYLRDRDAKYAIDALHAIDRLPRTESGKVDRPALRKRIADLVKV